jgi:hypothetical protein
MVSLDYPTETWALGVGGAFAALAVFNFVPIVNLIRILPTFKEILIGAALVVLLLDTTDLGDGAVFSLIVGMVAAVAVNVVRFVLATVVGLTGVLGGMGGGMGPGPGGAGMGMSGSLGFAALGAVVNFVGVIVFSPVGYLIGGAAGAFLNENL